MLRTRPSRALAYGEPSRMLPQPPGRGGGDRRCAGRSARDDAADRGARDVVDAGASQPRLLLRIDDTLRVRPSRPLAHGSDRAGTRVARGAIGAQPVFAESRKLHDEVERRPDSLSELREHAFEKVRPAADGSRNLLQVRLQAPQ
jgi:hypothetical protein